MTLSAGRYVEVISGVYSGLKGKIVSITNDLYKIHLFGIGEVILKKFDLIAALS